MTNLLGKILTWIGNCIAGEPAIAVILGFISIFGFIIFMAVIENKQRNKNPIEYIQVITTNYIPVTKK